MLDSCFWPFPFFVFPKGNVKVFVLFVHFDVLFVGVCLVGDSLVDEKVTRVLYNYAFLLLFAVCFDLFYNGWLFILNLGFLLFGNLGQGFYCQLRYCFPVF